MSRVGLATTTGKAGLALVAGVCVVLPACQQRMARQPSYRPDETSAFFRDGRADRPIPRGTVARGHLHWDLHLFAGKRAGSESSAHFSQIANDGVCHSVDQRFLLRIVGQVFERQDGDGLNRAASG